MNKQKSVSRNDCRWWETFNQSSLLSLTLKKVKEKSVDLTVLPLSDTAGLPRHNIWFLSDRFCYTPCCPLENEDRCFNGLKQFDLQVLLSPWLITPPALTPGIIDTLSTVGRGLRASDGLSFCIPQTITVLTGNKKRRGQDQPKITLWAARSSGRFEL